MESNKYGNLPFLAEWTGKVGLVRNERVSAIGSWAP